MKKIYDRPEHFCSCWACLCMSGKFLFILPPPPPTFFLLYTMIWSGSAKNFFCTIFSSGCKTRCCSSSCSQWRILCLSILFQELWKTRYPRSHGRMSKEGEHSTIYDLNRQFQL